MRTFLLMASFVIGCFFTITIRENAASPTTPAALLSANEANEVIVTPYGTTATGEKVSAYRMKNKNGLELTMIDYGATVTSLKTPDKNGQFANVVLTCPDLAGFQNCTMYFNGTVGRFCNRIAKGQFRIGDQQYQLATNNGPNHLHGGVQGFDKRLWKAEPFTGTSERGVKFSLVSPDGEEGYPGTLKVSATYTLTDADELIVEYRAATDKATPVNLTNHNYWNLAGQGTILNHELQLNSTQYLPVDDTAIPTGELLPTSGTPFDFSRATAIGSRIAQVTGDPGGYDHCYVIDGANGDMRWAAKVKDPVSGRTLEIKTTEPGIQFYSGNFLNGEVASGGYAQHSGFCLETQHFPDSPNQAQFPTTLLQPGASYFHRTVHAFGVAK